LKHFSQAKVGVTGVGGAKIAPPTPARLRKSLGRQGSVPQRNTEKSDLHAHVAKRVLEHAALALRRAQHLERRAARLHGRRETDAGTADAEAQAGTADRDQIPRPLPVVAFALVRLGFRPLAPVGRTLHDQPGTDQGQDPRHQIVSALDHHLRVVADRVDVVTVSHTGVDVGSAPRVDASGEGQGDRLSRRQGSG
jgi:hypothetical protein